MRAIEKKRKPYLTWKKGLILALTLMTFLCTWFILYMLDVIEPNRNEKDAKIQWAMNQQQIQKVDQVYKHIWDNTSWIIEGTDENASQVYLFEQNQTILFRIAKQDVLSVEELRQIFLQSNEDAEVIRITPGVFQSAPAWEVYYTKTDAGKTHYYYSFYSFDQNGDWLETYRLPDRTGS